MYKPENIRTIENHDLVKLAVVIDQTELFPSEMLGEMIEPSFSDPESSDIWITYIHDFVNQKEWLTGHGIFWQ